VHRKTKIETRCLRAKPSKDGDAEPRGFDVIASCQPGRQRIDFVERGGPVSFQAETAIRSRNDMTIADKSKTAERR